MTSDTTQQFQPELLELFDQYVHGNISRRNYLLTASKFAAGLSALFLLGALHPRFAATNTMLICQQNGNTGVAQSAGKNFAVLNKQEILLEQLAGLSASTNN